MSRTRFLSALLLLASTAGSPGAALAQVERAEGPTPPRLATVEGEVSFWRPGADDWAPAQINTALAAGDRLYTGPGGRVGLELANRAWVRADADTEIGLASLETGYLQFELTSGRAAVDLQRLPDGQRIEVDTPNGAIIIERAGYYRFDVSDETTLTLRRGGEASIVPAGVEDETLARDGQQIVLTGTDTAQLATHAAPAPDAFDQGNDRLFAARSAPARSAQYVPAGVAGTDDLDAHGDWRATADYGQVWVPRDVGQDWAPYTTGRWNYDPYYSWTWVDDASWGWAPYHYGRWVYADNYWGWAPGPVVAQPVYSPALVGFVDAPGVNISLSVGVPFVSWVSLGYGEPCLPWWGPRGFRGRPWWGGWGGRRYVNNTYIDNRRIVNVNNINRWRNFDGRGGVVGMRRDRFGRGRDNFRLGRDDIGRLRAARRGPDVRPVSQSLVARDGRGRRPPDRIRDRTVVGTRAPQDPSRRLQRAGLRAPRERQQVRVQETRRDRQPGGRNQNRFAAGDPPPPNADRRARRDERNQMAGRNTPPVFDQNDRRQSRRDDRMRDQNERRASRGAFDAPPPPRAERRQDRREQRQTQQLERQDRRQQRQQDQRDQRAQRQADRRQRLTTTPPPRFDGQTAPRAERQARQQTRRAEREPTPRVDRQPAPRAERRPSPRVERRQAQRAERQRAPRVERDRQPRTERQAVPRMERRQAPMRAQSRPPRQQPRFEARQQRQAPRVETRQQRQAPSRATSVRPQRGGGGGGDGRRAQPGQGRGGGRGREG